MSVTPDNTPMIVEDEGWHVVPKKKLVRTDTNVSMKSTVSKKKDVASVPASVPPSVVSTSNNNNVITTAPVIPNTVKPAVSVSKSTAGSVNKSTNGGKYEPKPTKGGNATLNNINKKKKKKTKEFGKGDDFNTALAPKSSWRPDNSGVKRTSTTPNQVTATGKTSTNTNSVDESVVVIAKHNEDSEDEEESYYSDDDSDYSDDSGDDDDDMLSGNGTTTNDDNTSIHSSNVIGRTNTAGNITHTLTNTKVPTRSILRSSTNITTAVGQVQQQVQRVDTSNNVVFNDSKNISTDNSNNNTDSADGLQRCSTLPSGKYIPPFHRTESQYSVKLNDPKTANINADDNSNVVVEATTTSPTGESNVIADDAASVTSGKLKRTNTATSTRKKGTPGVFKNKERHMDANWRDRPPPGSVTATSQKDTNNNAQAGTNNGEKKKKKKKKKKATTATTTVDANGVVITTHDESDGDESDGGSDAETVLEEHLQELHLHNDKEESTSTTNNNDINLLTEQHSMNNTSIYATESNSLIAQPNKESVVTNRSHQTDNNNKANETPKPPSSHANNNTNNMTKISKKTNQDNNTGQIISLAIALVAIIFLLKLVQVL